MTVSKDKSERLDALTSREFSFFMYSGIDDYDIQALVDDELEPDEARRVKQKIDQTPKLQERYDELMQQKTLLQQWWQRLH